MYKTIFSLYILNIWLAIIFLDRIDELLFLFFHVSKQEIVTKFSIFYTNDLMFVMNFIDKDTIMMKNTITGFVLLLLIVSKIILSWLISFIRVSACLDIAY